MYRDPSVGTELISKDDLTNCIAAAVGQLERIPAQGDGEEEKPRSH